MKVTLKDVGALDEKREKLLRASQDEAFKMLYQWVKQDVISCKAFGELVRERFRGHI